MAKSIQFIQFAMIGVVNTVLDLGVFSLFIVMFGLTWSPYAFPLFKSISFIVAVANSYLWNKHWVFKQHSRDDQMREATIFVIVSVLGLVINAFISYVVFLIGVRAYAGMRHIIIADGAALVGTLCVLAWNFIGYKFLVFKK